MARMEFDGINDVINEAQLLGTNVTEVGKRMVQKAAEVVAKERIKEAKRRKLKDGGEMIDNIRPVRAVKEVKGALEITVYSQGTDRTEKHEKTPVRNAAKEFMNHYGYKSKPATHWVDSAEKKAAPIAEISMVQIWNEFIWSGGKK